MASLDPFRTSLSCEGRSRSQRASVLIWRARKGTAHSDAVRFLVLITWRRSWINKIGGLCSRLDPSGGGKVAEALKETTGIELVWVVS